MVKNVVNVLVMMRQQRWAEMEVTARAKEKGVRCRWRPCLLLLTTSWLKDRWRRRQANQFMWRSTAGKVRLQR